MTELFWKKKQPKKNKTKNKQGVENGMIFHVFVAVLFGSRLDHVGPKFLDLFQQKTAHNNSLI